MDEYYEQHPIPQQISSYQFRLVGDMTLKQFFQVAGGALVSLFIYSSGLPGYVKWPLIIVSFLFGVALAFFPFEDRPLSKWIVLYFKAIYSPTIFVWKKTSQKPVFFQTEAALGEEFGHTERPIDIPGGATVKVLEETQSAPAEQVSLEKREAEFLTRVEKQFKPSAFTPQDTAVAIPGSIPIQAKVVQQKSAPEPVAIQPPPTDDSFGMVAPMQSQQISGNAARFSPEAAPPIPPTRPNVIVGQVADPAGKIVESAILEIRDSEGRPVRALRSNQLGHFMIITPLVDGKYEIITEKQGLEFEPVTMELTGNIVQPIAIWAKSKTEVS